MTDADIRIEALRFAVAIKPMEYVVGGEPVGGYQSLGGPPGYTPKASKGGWTPEELIAAAQKIEAWINPPTAAAKKPARKVNRRAR